MSHENIRIRREEKYLWGTNPKNSYGKKMSQAALSRALQLEGITIDRYSICRMEKGERFIADYELIKIAGILDVPVSFFFPGAEDK